MSYLRRGESSRPDILAALHTGRRSGATPQGRGFAPWSVEDMLRMNSFPAFEDNQHDAQRHQFKQNQSEAGIKPKLRFTCCVHD